MKGFRRFFGGKDSINYDAGGRSRGKFKFFSERYFAMEAYQLWAGTYTQGESRDGIFRLGFDGRELRVLESWGGLTDPSYLQPAGGKVYAVEELPAGGSIIELEPGVPEYRRWELPGSGYCHVAVCGNFLYASGYSGGCLAGFDLNTHRVCEYIEHHGRGPDPERQERAHIHSSRPSPDGGGLFVADLGLDRLFRYETGPDGRLSPHEDQPWVQVSPGQGPRHFAYHPGGGCLYLVTEMGQTLRTYRYANGALNFQNEYPLYNVSPAPGDTAADVHLTPDGRFIYASVRGSDRIFCYKVTDDPGKLEPAGSFPSGGTYPRSLHISPDGRYLAAANQLSGNVAVFRVGPDGGLSGPAAGMALPGAVCVKWAKA